MQLSYPLEMGVGINGDLADAGNNDVLTYNNPSHAVSFGRALEKITGDADGVKPPDNGSAVIVGVSLRELNESANYPVKSSVSVLRKGRVYVEVEEAVTPDSSPYYRYDGKDQVQTITLSTDLITGNKVNGKVNGNAIAETTYASSHNATWAAVAALIAAQPGVLTAEASGDVITITSEPDQEIELSDFEVTEGASQPTVTIEETVAMIPTSDRGKFRASADSSTAAALTGAKFLTAASAGGVAILDINLP